MANFREDLLKETLARTKKLTKQVNQRILRLERETGGETYEIMKLRTYLDTDYTNAWTKKGRVTYSKIKMDPLKLDAINKQMQKFIDSPSSTVRGIRNELKQYREETGKPDFSYEDLYDYKRTYDDLLEWIKRYMEESEFWQITHKAHDLGWGEDMYFKAIIQQADASITNDEDARERIQRLYYKYVVMIG